MKLETLNGWAFDLDGVIWAGTERLPGAVDLVETLRAAGRRVVFLSNNSRATPGGIVERLASHGISAAPQDVILPIGAAGQYLSQRYGPSKVLVVGIPELRSALAEQGHVPVDDPLTAEAVVFGSIPDFNYEHLAALCRAVDRGVPFLVLNRDLRYPVEGGTWLPGLGAWVAAVEAATGRKPELVGKPSPMLFRAALSRLGTVAEESVMVGDTPAADIAGGLGAGMWTIQVGEAKGGPEPHLQVANLAELLALWRERVGSSRVGTDKAPQAETVAGVTTFRLKGLDGPM